jgi:hypothetical protein
MTDGAAMATPYSRLGKGEKQLHDRPLFEALSALKTLVPLSRPRFDRILAQALEQAERRGTGFYIGGFAARRALGARLLIDIDPSVLEKQLDYRVRQGNDVYSIRDRFLGAGNWTPLLHLLRRSSTHKEVREIVEAGFEYKSTEGYRRALERAGTARPVKRNFVALSTPAKVEAYFRHTAEMCRSIERHGMLRRADYGLKRASFGRPSIRLPWVELGELDIGVAIGSSGEIYRFASGKHRTPAAQALGLKSMPVEVRLVHADWLRRKMEETGLPATEALLAGIGEIGRAP